MKTIVHYGLHTPGNAGDTLLFEATRRVFDKYIGPFRWIKKSLHTQATDRDIEQINSEADAVLIGGGGLFLRDTKANLNSGWQWNCGLPQLTNIQKPLIVFAIGYNRFRGQAEFEPIFKKHLNAVARRTIFFGLRNNGSVACTKSYLNSGLEEQLRYQPCPTVLLKYLYPEYTPVEPSKKTITLNMAFDRPEHRYGLNKPKLAMLKRIAEAIKQTQQQDNFKVQLVCHCSPDAGFAQFLDNCEVEYELKRLDNLPSKHILELYQNNYLTVGMRGHAQMVPFGFGHPIISLISHDKVVYFLEDIGQKHWGLEVSDPEIVGRLRTKIKYMQRNRAKVRARISKLQEVLLETTKQNLEMIARQI